VCRLLKGDSLSKNVHASFSTKDKDNDKSKKNCAKEMQGGWWYTDCGESNLTGKYLSAKSKKKFGMFWKTWKGFDSLGVVKMMVREYDIDLDVDRK